MTRPRPDTRSSTRRSRAVAWLIVGATLTAGCGGGDRSRPDPPDWLTDRTGGATTARALRGRPFNQAARTLSNSELGRFADGAEVFDRHVVAEDGLGPAFNDDGCLSCHLDGQDRPADEIDEPPGFLIRISGPGGEVAGFGGQLQTRSTDPTVAIEADVVFEWETVEGRYADGTRHQLRRPAHRVTTRVPLPEHTASSQRVATPLLGLGLLEAIPATSLRAAADPDDLDDDGISGRVNEVDDPTAPGYTTVGRFGWKAAQATVASQTHAALEEDMGMRVTPGPEGEPVEVDPVELADMIFYNRTIAVPIGRGGGSGRDATAGVQRGAIHFERLGCAGCHTPTQRSGPDEVAGLAGQRFHPFTDLLLHEMGAGLADGRREGRASGSEWRTAPLWGIGRRVEVTGHRSFLHDGRARTPTEAVLWHGGEAAAAKRAFVELDADERRELEAFLASL